MILLWRTIQKKKPYEGSENEERSVLTMKKWWENEILMTEGKQAYDQQYNWRIYDMKKWREERYDDTMNNIMREADTNNSEENDDMKYWLLKSWRMIYNDGDRTGGVSRRRRALRIVVP